MGTQDSTAHADSTLESDVEVGTSEVGSDQWWVQVRWANILDRIEFRRADVGLRFWGPPLWLEVTMAGPDSDLWPANDPDNRSWNWQSSEPCAGLDALVSDGADDDALLAVVARYTVENLILNAAHEIGEWFRFDGRRLFPAHASRANSAGAGHDQGNGDVAIQLDFDPAPDFSRTPHLATGPVDPRMASRFTYLPGTTITFEAVGPVIRTYANGEAPKEWRSTWSEPTWGAAGLDVETLLPLVGRDVHGALVSYELDRICRAFRVDGRQPWHLIGRQQRLEAGPPKSAAMTGEPLSISITYGSTPPDPVLHSRPGSGSAAGAPLSVP